MGSKIRDFISRFKILFVVIFIILIIILAVLLPSIIYPFSPAHNLIIKYLSLIFSLPVVILVLSIFFIFTFKEQIGAKIEDLIEARFPSTKLRWKEQQKKDEDIERKRVEKAIMEKLSEQENKIDILKNFCYFEEKIRYMYASQFSLLKEIKKEGKVYYLKIMYYYSVFLKRGGNKSYPISEYLGWLVGIKFIEEYQKDNSYILTELGKGFLKYCKIREYSEKTFIPL